MTKLIIATFFILSIGSAWGANFIRLGEYGNEIETSSIKTAGDYAYYVIRRSTESTSATGVNVVVNCVTRQRAEQNNLPGISVNKEKFVDIYPGTPNAAELSFVCGTRSAVDNPAPTPSAAQKIEAAEAELTLMIAQYNATHQGPHRTYINASSGPEQAAYYLRTKQKIEKTGTANFPKINGKSLYGSALVSIPIFQDGTIYENEGGPVIKKSSGIDALDKAILRIVRKAAPFDKFPEALRKPGKGELWILSSRFTFERTSDDASSTPTQQILNDGDYSLKN